MTTERSRFPAFRQVECDECGGTGWREVQTSSVRGEEEPYAHRYSYVEPCSCPAGHPHRRDRLS